jgi:hypothetical protein
MHLQLPLFLMAAVERLAAADLYFFYTFRFFV